MSPFFKVMSAVLFVFLAAGCGKSGTSTKEAVVKANAHVDKINELVQELEARRVFVYDGLNALDLKVDNSEVEQLLAEFIHHAGEAIGYSNVNDVEWKSRNSVIDARNYAMKLLAEINTKKQDEESGSN